MQKMFFCHIFGVLLLNRVLLWAAMDHGPFSAWPLSRGEAVSSWTWGQPQGGAVLSHHHPGHSLVEMIRIT